MDYPLPLRCSLALSVDGVAHHPQAAFYLLPSRIWELGLGAVVAVLPRTFPYPVWVQELASGIGLAMILCAIFCYDASTPFPGIAALLPCVGAALFILSNGPKLTTSGKFLCGSPFVVMGLLSYSLYLWHWPILVFANYWALNQLSIAVRLGLLSLCFLLAVASWKYVEIPCRKRRLAPRKIGVFFLALATASILIVSGAVISRFDGLRLNSNKGTKSDIEIARAKRFETVVQIGSGGVVVTGDKLLAGAH
jgi:peptidoglycan/LPS O-acetylase OafA/YrhL